MMLTNYNFELLEILQVPIFQIECLLFVWVVFYLKQELLFLIIHSTIVPYIKNKKNQILIHICIFFLSIMKIIIYNYML